ncbi:alpha-ketoacid dehydrogenase subunit beta [Nocardia sp. NPDC127526]|uniref:alpha-ketoacid dehydrogenase subunit beta n=1 Tax=Nocardia sp. NPDC127526 TaxID=3345393 RepID=UPI0036321418
MLNETRSPCLAEAINDTLAGLLADDPRTVLLGEDIGRLGGVFRVTRDLRRRFGPDRVRDAVLAESSIIGSAIGMSLAGLVPICEIQFDGFVFPAANQLVTQASRMVDRWNGDLALNLVVRVPSGGGFRGVEHHSDSNEAFFAHAPGISVACPSTPGDAARILRHAAGLGRPVMIYEPIRLYWRRELPERADIGAESATGARIARTGADLTVVTFGAITCDVLTAAAAADVEAEVIDLRWVSPIDVDAILTSVARTGRLLIVHEAAGFAGIGAEIAAMVCENGFHHLHGPIRRVAARGGGYPPADFENDHVPGVERIIEEMRKAVG